MPSQQTIAEPISVSGIGLHSGLETEVTLHPAQANTGYVFAVQCPTGQEAVPAHISYVHATQLSTALKGERVQIRTIEHLLAALWGMGVDNVIIGIASPTDVVELPILDGSAREWVQAIDQVGLVAQSADTRETVLHQPYTVYQGDAFVCAIPSPYLRFTYGIDFPSQAIGQQWCTWAPRTDGTFANMIAPARTFTLLRFIDTMRSQGLIKGGSLENAIVCDDKTWINPPLRFSDEPCRHKLLDLIGDLSLLGHIPTAHYVAYKASHHLHCQLAVQISTDHAFDRT